MGRIGARLLNQTKDNSKGGKSSSRKDVLSLLVQANDLPEAQQMKDEDVMGRAYKRKNPFWCFLNYGFDRDPYFPHRWSRNNKVHTPLRPSDHSRIEFD